MRARLISANPYTLAVALLLYCTCWLSSMQAQGAASKSRAAMEREEKIMGRRAAYTAFKAGNAAAAVTALSAIVQKWSEAETQEVDLGRQLATISFAFRNEGDPALAASVATLSLNRLANAEARLGASESVKVLTLAGSIYEHVLDDLRRARQAYERALALDPRAVHANESLTRIVAMESAATEKAVANQILSKRRSEKGNP